MQLQQRMHGKHFHVVPVCLVNLLASWKSSSEITHVCLPWTDDISRNTTTAKTNTIRRASHVGWRIHITLVEWNEIRTHIASQSAAKLNTAITICSSNDASIRCGVHYTRNATRNDVTLFTCDIVTWLFQTTHIIRDKSRTHPTAMAQTCTSSLLVTWDMKRSVVLTMSRFSALLTTYPLPIVDRRNAIEWDKSQTSRGAGHNVSAIIRMMRDERWKEYGLCIMIFQEK